MAQIKPIDLKKIAKRFTEEFYPDWVSRFDRIWDMFEKLDPDSIATGTDKSQSQLGNALGITGLADPESRECIGGIAVCAFTYKQVQDKSSVSEAEIRQKISIIPNFKITPALQRKLEYVLAEMVPSMMHGVCEQDENREVRNLSHESPGLYDETSFVVYVNRESGLGSKKFIVSEDDLHTQFLTNKGKYDIIIYDQNVEIKLTTEKNGNEAFEFEGIELYANILNLFILFLKYKNKDLPFLKLYHNAWKDSGVHETRERKTDEMIDSLKHAVSSLRNLKKQVEDFNIPNAKRGSNTYVLKGGFKFCLILRDDMDRRYTL